MMEARREVVSSDDEEQQQDNKNKEEDEFELIEPPIPQPLEFKIEESKESDA